MAISKRTMLANLLRVSGVLYLAERIPGGRPFLIVVNYHRIGDPSLSELDRDVFSTTEEELDRQVDYLKKRFHALSSDEILELPETVKNLDVPSFMITFDDGYRDNYDLAYPILKKHDVPAVFFVTTGFMQNKQLPWWDAVAYVLRNSKKSSITLPVKSKYVLRLEEVGPDSVIEQVLKMMKSDAALDFGLFISELAEACGVELEEESKELRNNLFMTEDMIKELSENGMVIGGHTHTHRLLSHLSLEEQREELTVSRDILSGLLGKAPALLAYPVGTPDAWTKDTERIAKELGYRCGFSYYGGALRKEHQNWFDIPRESIETDINYARFRMNIECLKRWNYRY